MVRVDTLWITALRAHTVLCFNLISPELRVDKPPGALVSVVVRPFIQTPVLGKLQASLGIEGCTVHVEPREKTLGLAGRSLELRSTDLTGVDAIERKQDV